MQGSCKYQTKPTWTFFVNPQVSRVRTEWPWCSSWVGSRTRKSPRWDFCPRWRTEAQSTSLPLQNSSMGQPGSNPWWKNWSLPHSRVCERQWMWEALCTQAHQLLFLARHWRKLSWDQLVSSSPHPFCTCVPAVCGTSKQTSSGKEREIPAHGLTWQPILAAGMGLVLLFGKVPLFSFSSALVGDGISACYPPKVLRRQDVLYACLHTSIPRLFVCLWCLIHSMDALDVSVRDLYPAGPVILEPFNSFVPCRDCCEVTFLSQVHPPDSGKLLQRMNDSSVSWVCGEDTQTLPVWGPKIARAGTQ